MSLVEFREPLKFKKRTRQSSQFLFVRSNSNKLLRINVYQSFESPSPRFTGLYLGLCCYLQLI